MHVFIKLKHFELCTRVTTGFCQLLHDILQGRQSHFVGDVLRQHNLLSEFFVLDQIRHRAVQVFRHFLNHLVAFRMHRTTVQRILRLTDTQKTSCLLESLCTETRHILQPFARSKWTVLVAIVNNVLRQCGSHTRNIR